MKIERVVLASTFTLKASREDLEALKVCLHQVYHFQHEKIPVALQSVTSRLMDTVEAAIKQDDNIQRKARI